MYKSETPSMFNTLEGYENFVSQLLEKETDLKVDPMLELESAMDDQDFVMEKSTKL